MTYKQEFRRCHVRLSCAGMATYNYIIMTMQLHVQSFPAEDNGRVADCIERADHFWTLRSDEECLAFDNNYIVHCNLTIIIVEVVAFVVFSLLLPQPL